MKKRILIADDDPAIVESTTLILEEFGYEVAATMDGKTVHKMKKNSPDLLLLDIWMSGFDGREICKQIKKDPSTKHIPIIMISASRNIASSAKEAGADDFIAKPFDMEQLIEKVEKNLHKKQRI